MENSGLAVLIVVSSLIIVTAWAPLLNIPYWEDISKEIFEQAEEFYQDRIKPIISGQRDVNGQGGAQTPQESGAEESEITTEKEPPDINVSIQIEEKPYLGDHPQFEITVTNNGGACEVDYTAFETQPESGSFHLDSNDTKTVIETRRQVEEIGNWSASVNAEARNESGTDRSRDTVNFEVDVKPFNAEPYINEDELSDINSAIERLKDSAEWIWDTATGLATGKRADAMDQFVTSDSGTVESLANALKSRHPNDRELQAKELYYFVLNWIEYDHSVSQDPLSNPLGYGELINYQGTYPVETLSERKGVCINYALTLASLYEAAGFDARGVVVWGDQGCHSLLLLHYPNLDYAYYYEGNWMVLDPTYADSLGWKFGEYNPQGWDHADTVDVE